MTPGVCFTYDDHFVENWQAARPVFDAFGAKVSFCVCNLHQLSTAEIDGLHQLQDDGHEIAFHSRTHPRLRAYLDTHGLDRWVAEEIERGMDEHRALGFPATSFASPYHSSTPATRRATAERFLVTRARGPKGLTEAELPERVYRNLGPLKLVHNIGMLDMHLKAQPGWHWFAKVLDTIADEAGVGVFTGHNISNVLTGQGGYCTHDELHRQLSMVAERKLSFFTLSGFAQSVSPRPISSPAGI